MAEYIQGFDEQRFVSKVDRNFFCLICLSVLKDPVLCPRNHHCFCRGCITKHLENNQRCPTCADELTVETLAEPQRMVKDYINELNIRCVYVDRGCQEIVQLQHLDQHEATCGFTPTLCTNPGCGVTVNKHDHIYHKSEVCKFKKCHSCEEMTKSLVKMEKRVERMERNLAVMDGNVATNMKSMKTNMSNIEKGVATNMRNIEGNLVASMERSVATNMRNIERNLVASMERNVATKVSGMEEKMATNFKNMERTVTAKIERNVATNMANMKISVSNNGKYIATKMENMERNVATSMGRNATDMQEKFEAVKNDVTCLNTALVKAFDEMKDVLIKVEDKIEENQRQKKDTVSGDRENIIVAGGAGTNTVEMYNWYQRTWSSLQPMPNQCLGATSFVYNNHVAVVGGFSADTGLAHNIISMNFDSKPDPSLHWSDCPVGLRAKSTYHSSVVYNSQLIIVGGNRGNGTSDYIEEMQLVFPYATRVLSRMPIPRQNHCMEIFDDSLLIIGGTTTGRYQDSLSSVLLCDIKINECKQLAPLPYEVSQMATVKWGDNIVVIGGVDKHGKLLNTVLIYNVKIEQYHMLPAMRFKRVGCTAVVIGNNIVVLGGLDEHRRVRKSVEAFNFDRNTWEELPEMSAARWLHTAVVV